MHYRQLGVRCCSGGNDAKVGETDMPSKAYIQEVVEEIKKGEKGECPICLEKPELRSRVATAPRGTITEVIEAATTHELVKREAS